MAKLRVRTATPLGVALPHLADPIAKRRQREHENAERRIKARTLKVLILKSGLQYVEIAELTGIHREGVCKITADECTLKLEVLDKGIEILSKLKPAPFKRIR